MGSNAMEIHFSNLNLRGFNPMNMISRPIRVRKHNVFYQVLKISGKLGSWSFEQWANVKVGSCAVGKLGTWSGAKVRR